jgi:hypothetical protein
MAAISSILFVSAAYGQNDMSKFITRSGDKLMEGEKEYRFVSFNMPNLHLVEDNMSFEATNEWRFPNEFEIADALESIKQLGGRVTRIYPFSVCRRQGPNAIPCHVRGPGDFNEEAFRALDKVMETANRVGVRVIVPLVDNWWWWGGIREYADYRGKPQEAFWTDRQVIDDFKRTVSFILNRRNTHTGRLYKDDKAILAWETGNEISCPYSWTKEIAAYIKSLDSNHLVWDGLYLGHEPVQPESLADPNVDIVSSHHYPEGKGPDQMVEDITRFKTQIGDKKVYIVGEFGFVPLAGIEKVLDAVIKNGVVGALIWSLRFHNRDGGFYWHSEPSGLAIYKAYHYPGFASAGAYHETDLLRLMRAKAYEISGLTPPASEKPAPPVLLSITSAAEISWRGSVGASSYDVERATDPNGPWTIVGMNADDASVQYRPLFSDSYVEPGNTYYYRVRARNSAGVSSASNVVGPVRVEEYAITDELSDFSKVFGHGGGLSFETANPRQYKEDAHRLKGRAGSWIMYRSLKPLRSVTVLAFMEGEEKGFEFYVSNDGAGFVKVEPKVGRFPNDINPYGYKLPVQYELRGFSSDYRILKIVFGTDAQISRVELRHGG